jgi:hypothetical protein
MQVSYQPNMVASQVILQALRVVRLLAMVAPPWATVALRVREGLVGASRDPTASGTSLRLAKTSTMDLAVISREQR